MPERIHFKLTEQNRQLSVVCRRQFPKHSLYGNVNRLLPTVIKYLLRSYWVSWNQISFEVSAGHGSETGVCKAWGESDMIENSGNLKILMKGSMAYICKMSNACLMLISRNIIIIFVRKDW